MMNKILIYLIVFGGLFLNNTLVMAATINVVAAENVYGNIASQLGGKYVKVMSILKKPGQDPHLFSSSPATAVQIAQAQVVIYNGDYYDPWILNFLRTSHTNEQKIINVAELAQIQDGENPHIWYSPLIIEQYAQKLSQLFIELDPQDRVYYQNKLNQFLIDNHQLMKRIMDLRKETKDISVIATEPVFGYMSDLLGFDMKGTEVQWQIMNDIEPSPMLFKRYERLIEQKRVKLLFYNEQVTSPVTTQIKNLASIYHIPLVGVYETQPLQYKTYYSWMNALLDNIEINLKAT